MAGRTAEAVVQLHMPKSGIDVVLDEEMNSQSTSPDTLRLSCWAIDLPGRLSNLVHLLRVFRLSGRLTLIASFWFLSSGEKSRKKKSRYARSACDQTHPDGAHVCSKC